MKVKFLVQKKQDFVKNARKQQRHEMVDNFYSIYFLDVDRGSTLHDIEDQLMQELTDFSWLPQNYNKLAFINKGSKPIKNKKNPDILDQAIGSDEVLGQIFQEYEIFETIKIEIVPKIVKVRFQSSGLQEQIVLEKDVKIYGRMDDFYLDCGFYKPILTEGYLYQTMSYENCFGDDENIEIIMKRNLKNSFNNLNNKDELIKTVWFREMCFPFYNMNANFHEKINCTVYYKQTNSLSEYTSKANQGLKSAFNFYLKEVCPQWAETTKRVKKHCQFIGANTSNFSFLKLQNLLNFNQKKITDVLMQSEEEKDNDGLVKKLFKRIVNNAHKTHLEQGSKRIQDLYSE